MPWLVGQLAFHLTGFLITEPDMPLAETLAAAITRVCEQHAGTCDLTNQDSPSCTAAILRERSDHVDYLVLCDSPIVLQAWDGTVRPVVDNRTSHLTSYTREAIRQVRNTPDGFWVASTKPEAAHHALTGNMPRGQLQHAALLTDGASRLVEHYGHSWPDVLNLLDAAGPEQLIRRVREAEMATSRGRYRGKHHDDATAVLCRFTSDLGAG